MRDFALCSPTIAGIPKLFDRIAVWESGPPDSVIKPTMPWFCKSIVSAGVKSLATIIIPLK